jgi:hypothetical protein
LSWLQGWKYRRKITVSPANIDEDLTGYPLYVPLAGDSYRFTAADGETLLKHKTYKTTCSYVKIDPTASDGLTFFAYYGNDEAEDGSDAANALPDYAAFAPLYDYENGDTDLKSGLSLSLGGSASAGSEGIAMNGGYVSIGGVGAVQALLSGETGLTYSAICRDLVPGASADDYLAADKTSTPNYWMVWAYGTTAWGVHYSPNGGFADAAKVILSAGMPGGGNDYHLAFTYKCYDGVNPATVELFTNGVSDGTGTSANTDQTLSYGTIAVPEAIGYAQGTSRSINATISEYRIRKGAVSEAWLKFEYANLMNEGNEITIGPQREQYPLNILGV